MADTAVTAGHSSKEYLKKPYKLLRQGADATITDEDGNGAFHYLVQSDMFQEPASPDSVFDKSLRPPSPVDDPSMTMEGLILSLQAAGADINLQNKKGDTPLHTLCKNASEYRGIDENLCGSLCDAGADLNIRDRQGRSAVFSLFLTSSLQSWDRDEDERLCQLVSRLGGQFDVQDNRGESLIHCLFSSHRAARLSLVEALVRHGVDPYAVDNEGNNLWHVAVGSLSGPVQGRRQLFDLLLGMGLDPRRANKSGRTVLHALSSHEAAYLGERMTVFPACIPDIGTTVFDYLLYIYLNNGYQVDIRDSQGITALHLACTFSEYQSGRLLEAGADPKVSTHEGLTPFHLAARCGQANIIGLLLEKAKARESEPEGDSPNSIQKVINSKDAYGRSPLYYACASGRAESVYLLLHAGASVQSDEYSGSVWQACAGFEEEQLNWSSSSSAYRVTSTASSVLIEGKTRPQPKRVNKFPRQHLGDVLRLLLQHHGAAGTSLIYLDKAISAAAAKQHDYTVWSLSQARNSLEAGVTTATVDELTSACLTRIDALGITGAASFSPKDLRAEFERLMRLRRHDLVQSLIFKHGWGELNFNGNTFIHDIVQHGFLSLLKGLTPILKELSKKLENVAWCDAQKLASSQGSFINRFPETMDQNFAQGSTQPLLLSACRSEEPNMEVVKFLIEEIGCGVDTQGYLRIYVPDSPTRYGICKHETPIHVLVRSGTHWWQVSEALSYHVQDQGANLELRDCFQSTPLAVAISHLGRITFNRAAVTTLLELGADAKSVDMGWTCENADITDLLLSRGAIVKPVAILAAVRSRNCDVLNMLLSRGGDVNVRETGVPEVQHRRNTPIYVETSAPPIEKFTIKREIQKHIQRDIRPDEPPPAPPADKRLGITIPAPPFVPENQMYPLDYAAHLYSRQPELDDFARYLFLPRSQEDDPPPRPQPLPGRVGLYDESQRSHPDEELERVIETLIANGADIMAEYELSDGSRMSIKDRIVMRGRDCDFRPLGRPQLARRILDLCMTDYEGEL